MADEMRRAVLALPWVHRFQLRLVDHFAADEINQAISEGLAFTDVFPAHASHDPDALRRTFDGKAFLMRQGAVVSVLRRRGLSDHLIVDATANELARMAASDDELAAAWSVYREKWEALDLALHPEGRIVVDLDGVPIAAAKLADHLRRIRGVTTSASANGEMCRMLMEARRGGAGCGTLQAGEQPPGATASR
jgi:hypothetical protein